MGVLLILGITIILGLISTRIVKLFNLPNVTGFLIMGLIIGPFATKLIKTPEELKAFNIICTVALGFIAFSIGAEFKISFMKQIGGKVLVITLFQAVAAAVFVMGALFIVYAIDNSIISMPQILILSAVATATAPASTLMVVRQFKAKGPVTDALLPVVAFDDAIGLMLFAILVGIAKVLQTGESPTARNMVLIPFLEILISVGIGVGLGLLLTLVCKFFKSRGNRMIWTIACVFIAAELSEMWKASSLLTCMIIGAVFANLRKDAAKTFERVDSWTPVLFMLFFMLTGAGLNVMDIGRIGIVGAVYVVSRILGKYLGTYVSAAMVKADKNIARFLGLCLLPQGGIAIGMLAVIQQNVSFTKIALSLGTLVLATTLIFEIIGPILSKLALKCAGEIQEKGYIPLIQMFIDLKNRKAIKAKKIEKARGLFKKLISHNIGVIGSPDSNKDISGESDKGQQQVDFIFEVPDCNNTVIDTGDSIETEETKDTVSASVYDKDVDMPSLNFCDFGNATKNQLKIDDEKCSHEEISNTEDVTEDGNTN